MRFEVPLVRFEALLGPESSGDDHVAKGIDLCHLRLCCVFVELLDKLGEVL